MGDRLPGCLVAILTVVWLIAAAYLISYARRADGQSRPTAAVMLARTCVSERGFAVETDDCGMIYAVARGRADRGGVSIVAALRALSPRLHGDSPIPRPWLRELDADGDQPASWPRAARWSAHREAWLLTLAEATAYLDGSRSSPCVEVPMAWGSRADVARRARLARDEGRRVRFLTVDCGATRNVAGSWVRSSTR
jgi:hypothetical protein